MSQNNNFKVLAGYYNYSNNRESNINASQSSDYPKNIKVSATAGLAEYSHCVSVEYSGNVYNNGITSGGIKIADGFNCTFKADTIFLDNNNSNGCISFVWTNNSLGEDIIPGNCESINYDNAVKPEKTPKGLFDDSLKEDGIKGLSVTLYPDTTEFTADHYTTKLNRYLISYKTNDNKLHHKYGYLPVITDIFDTEGLYPTDTMLFVEPVQDIYKFYLNGRMFAYIDDDSFNMGWGENEGYFTTTLIAAPYIDVNLEIRDIRNCNPHLTPKEETNLANLGVSVLNYYNAIDGDNYTNAFQAALRDETVRRVYVPGGTYKIKGELVVRDNCELELAQDAVLAFDFSGNDGDPGATAAADGGTTGGTNTEVGIEPWSDEKIIAAKKCITLNMLSSLVGNHATIRVPYDFDGIVIYASTRSHPEREMFKDIPPFNHYCPQWKPARYLKDINIVKPNTAGIHKSDDGSCNGIAAFIEGYRRNEDDDGDAGSTFIWGLEYTGLRIAGAFKYGIYGTNNYNETADDWAWTNDMKVNGIIDGCEVGVFLDNCNYAYISTLIQPRAAENNTKYAKYGIFLKECKHVDLTCSRVWDWDEDHTLGGPLLSKDNLTANKIYQHIGLKGDCKGLMLDDYLYYRNSDFNIRDLIYNDHAPNYDNMTILQEPVSKFFNIDVEVIEKEAGSEEGGESEPVSDPVPVTEIKGRLFVDRNINNETGELTTAFSRAATSMIPCDSITEITVTGFDFSNDSESIIAFYDENYDYIKHELVSALITETGDVIPTGEDAPTGGEPSIDYGTQEDIPVTLSFTTITNPKYFRISCKTDCIADIPQIIVGTVTIVFPCTCLKDHIYIKANYIEGLDERIRAILNGGDE